MGQFGIGQPIKRFEDQRLLRGEGRFHNDVNLPGQTHAVIVRSTHAHARIRSIDTAAALASPGVVAVFTGADLARDNLGTMQMTLKRKRPDGSPMFAPPHRGLTADRVRYVGDPVAMVIAETLAQAEDAAERLRIDYEPLPSVTSTADAIGGPAVWDECADNVSNLFESGDKATTDAAFAKAHRVVRRRYVITRVHAQYMEPRGALGVWDPGEERYTLYADVQYPHRVRNALANNIFKVPEHSIRVIAGDVGGGFGTKGWQYPEHRLVLWAAQEDPPARQVGVRAPRGHPRRRARARQRHRGRAGARRRGALSRPPGEDARQCRRLRLVRPEPPRHLQQCRHARRGLRVPRRPRRGPERPHEYQLDGAVPRSGTAGGDVRHRAADRRRGTRAGPRPGRAQAEEPHPGLGDAVQDAARRQLRLRRLPQEHGGRPQGRRRRGLRRPARGVPRARRAARHRRSSTPSSARPARSPSSPRSGSRRAGPRRS